MKDKRAFIQLNIKDKWNVSTQDQHSNLKEDKVILRDVKNINPDTGTIFIINNSCNGVKIIEDEDPRNEGMADIRPLLWTQVVAAVTCASVHMGIGASFAFTGILLPSLTNPNSTDIYLDINQVAVFSSVNNLGGIGGALVTGIIMTLIGQRITLLIALPLGAFAWTLAAFSTNFTCLVISRVIIGFTVGSYLAACHNYVAEISHPSIRGRLLGLSDLFRQIGALFIFILGSTNLYWRSVALVIGLTTSIPPFIVLCFLPNSPRWLSIVKREKEARAALKFYRGPTYNVNKELSEIFLQTEKHVGGGNCLQCFKIFNESTILKRIIGLSIIMFFLHFTGNVTLMSYSVSIFQSAKTNIDEYMSSVISVSMRILGAFTYTLIADKFKRRVLLIIPLCISGISMFCMGLYFYAILHYNIPGISWIPLASINVYLLTTGMYYPVIMLVRTELLPTSIRSVATGFLVVLLSIGMFIVVFLFPYMVNHIGSHFTFGMYGMICFFIVLIVLLLIPETKDKTLEEIEGIK